MNEVFLADTETQMVCIQNGAQTQSSVMAVDYP